MTAPTKADAAAYQPKHRADATVDTCKSWPIPHEECCTAEAPRHRAEVTS